MSTDRVPMTREGYEKEKAKLEYELEQIGIRLNRSKPDVVIREKKAGGLTINCTVPLTKDLDERTIRSVCSPCGPGRTRTLF